MARINEDGNIFGRLSALAVVAVVGTFVFKVQSGQCTFKTSKAKSKSCCIYSVPDDVRDAVAEKVSGLRK